MEGIAEANPKRRAMSMVTQFVCVYGVVIQLDLDEEFVGVIPECFPASWLKSRARKPTLRYKLYRQEGRILVARLGDSLWRSREEHVFMTTDRLDQALSVLEDLVYGGLALIDSRHTYIHGGGVRVHGQKLLLVGPMLSGVSTLISTLMDSGAEFLGDRWLAVHPDGKVSPLPGSLVIRYSEAPSDRTVVSAPTWPKAKFTPDQIYLSSFVKERAVELSEASVGQAASELMGCSPPRGLPQDLRSLCQLAKHSPVRRLRYLQSAQGARAILDMAKASSHTSKKDKLASTGRGPRNARKDL